MFDAHVLAVQVPGLEGDFGVLPGHANVFSMLRPGVIAVQMPDGVHRRFVAQSGYVDVTASDCTLISDHIQDESEADVCAVVAA
jgi:F-type H+-transporting ATPase subunit epsilon